MPIIDLQRRLARTGAIRLGNMITKLNQDGTPALNARGNPIQFPAKLDTFRVTSPHRDIIESVAEQHGGTVAPWHGQHGPEWEVVTETRKLPILVPPQHIDTNYEAWGKNVRTRLCDGARERLRGKPCLCLQWDNHKHLYGRDNHCKLCGISQKWVGEPHTHQPDETGKCHICGAGRICKPTTRLNVMIQKIPGIGVFKVESHGFTAAEELPALSEMIKSAPMPLPATLGMRYEERPYFDPATESIEPRQFWVPDIRFTFTSPEVLWYGTGRQLEQASREAITDSPALQALEGPIKVQPQPEPDTSTATTAADIYRIALTARDVATVRGLWATAQKANVLDKDMAKVLADRAAELVKASEQAETVEGDIVE